MSIIGIDFGNESCYVAVARSGGIETVDNDYSLRATSTTVAFGERQRILGVAAKNQLVTNITNTVFDFKRYLGRQFDDPVVQQDLLKAPFRLLPAYPATQGVGVEVKYLGKQEIFSVEQISAMLFTKLKETTENALQSKVTECVISVPFYFTNSQRENLLSSAKIAGLKVLQLLNDTAASALSYGIYKQDLPESGEKSRNVVFIDCGHAALQVCICAFNRGKLKVLASTFDSNLGGRNFDAALMDHFCYDFLQRYNIDPKTNPRSYMRLLTEVEKLKKQMSANMTKLPLNIECFMDDKDVSGSMCRSDFENLIVELLERVELTMRNCLTDSKLSLDEIHSVEIVGGSSRIPAIKLRIEKIFGKVASTTLNQDEAVARGCALQCAILSPVCKVRDFKITNVQPFPIKLFWSESESGMGFEKSLEIFPKYHPVPFFRHITIPFTPRPEYQVKAEYCGQVPIPNTHIGTYEFMIEDPKYLKLKVKYKLDINGIFEVTGAIGYKENQILDKAEEETDKMEVAADDTLANELLKDENASTNQENPEATKIILSSKTLLYRLQSSPSLSSELVYNLTVKESEMVAEDRKEQERIDAKNELEECVYNFKGKLENEMSTFVQDSDRTMYITKLNSLEKWLYEEVGLNESKDGYIRFLNSIKEISNPIFERYMQAQRRQGHFDHFAERIGAVYKVQKAYSPTKAAFSYLKSEDIQTLVEIAEENAKWIEDAKKLLSNTPNYIDPPIKTVDFKKKMHEFQEKVMPIVNKPGAPPEKQDEGENEEDSEISESGDNQVDVEMAD